MRPRVVPAQISRQGTQELLLHEHDQSRAVLFIADARRRGVGGRADVDTLELRDENPGVVDERFAAAAAFVAIPSASANATVAGEDTAKVRVYATNYNVLRVMSGMGGLAYPN